MLIDATLEKVLLSEAVSSSKSGDFFPGPSVVPCTHVAAVAGPYSFAGMVSPLRSLTHAPVAVAPQGSLVPHCGRSCHPGPSVAGVHTGCLLVAPGGQEGFWCLSPGSPSITTAACRCISIRLGGPPSGSDGCRSVIPRGELSPYQCAGDGSLCSGSGSLSAPVVGPECRPDERRRHGCRLPPESGRRGLSCVVLHGHRGSSLDRAPFSLPVGQVYSGEEECSGGPAQSSDQVLLTEWSRLPRVFEEICGVYGRPHLDLFAT